MGSPELALSTLASDESTGNRERGEVELLRAVASSRVGDERGAHDSLRDAFVFSVSSADAALESEVEFYRGLLAFGSGDLGKTKAACSRVAEIARTKPTFSIRGGNVPLEHVIARTEELLGMVRVAEGDYAASQRYIRASLATLDGCDIKDAYQEAFALRNLTVLASDFDLTEDAKLIADRVPTFSWTTDLTRPKFVTLESLGWCAAIGGDVPGALRHFRHAADAAKTAAEQAHVAIDRAQIAREVGHHGMVAEETDFALRLARTYDWDGAPGDVRNVLLLLAQVAASGSPEGAREMLDAYSRVKMSETPIAGTIEPRFQAEEAFAHGVVLRAEGRLDASSERLHVAFDIWTRIGFAWRAARAALELAELDAGDVFRLAVRRDLVRRPASIFAERARLVA